VRLLRVHGARPKYHHIIVGGNFRLDELQAAFLRVKLPHLDRWTAERRTVAAAYEAAFAAAGSGLKVRTPGLVDGHVYHQYVVRTPERDALRARLAAAGIETEIYYPAPLSIMPCFSGLPSRGGESTHANEAACTAAGLPMMTAGAARIASILR